MKGSIERVKSVRFRNQERGCKVKSKLFALVLVLAVSTLVFSGCVTPTSEPDAGLANPASVYCEEQGYTLEVRTDENGTYGVCIFPDGSECEEWAFFRGECSLGPGEVQPTEVPVVPTEPAVQTTEPRVAEESDVLFGGVSFSYDDALAADVVGQVVPAEGEDAPEWAWIPEHIRLSFEGYALPGTFHEPRILVFSAEDLAVNEMLQGIAANIQRVLAEKPDRPVGVFQAAGILPPMNAGHMMTPPQVSYLDFQNGTGVRFLTQMGQAYYPINNRDLFYTFQGITHDGKYYVAAILPISHSSLPADGSEIPSDDFNAFADNFEAYAAEVAAQLDAEAVDSFTPSVVLLDEMIQSLRVADLSAAATQSPVVAWYGYVASTPDGGQFDDYLVLLPEEARRAVGIEGADEDLEAEIVALRDKEEPGKHAHLWGTLNCDVPDYGGCQLLATRLRVDGPGSFFDPDPVEGWQGTIISGPAGPRSGGDDYLTVLVGGIPIAYGIDSTDATLAAQIECLRDTGTIVRVWGQVSAGVIDWNSTQIHVERMEIAMEAPARPAGYEGWKPYLNAELGYALWYPGDCQVMGGNLNESVQFSGPLVEGEHRPVLTVSHYDSDFYHPPAGTDVGQWIADNEIPYDAIDTEVEIAGLPTVQLRYEAGPGWGASDAYYFVREGQLFYILVLHTGGQEDWELYDKFLKGLIFFDA